MKKLCTLFAVVSISTCAFAQQNVGIGTNTPQSKLDVNGGVSIGANYAGTHAAPTNGALIEGAVGIGTPTPSASAILDVNATDKGLLLPRLTTAQCIAIPSPANGLMVYNTDLNCIYYYNGSTWTNAAGVGAPGATGPTGATGDQGAAGAQGAQGPAGTVGAQGPAGAVGPTGDQGAQGAAGAQGAQGPQGLAGAQGPVGTQGPVGPTGNQGIQGPAGAVGPQGAVGAQGPAGAVGPQGVQGPQGAVGAAGAIGPQGAVGPQGAIGPQGAVGPQGAQGPQGPAGTQGFLPNGSAAGNTPYWNGSSWVTNSSNIHNNGGNIGLGTTSPQAKLQVEGGKIFLSKTSFPNPAAYTPGDLVIGSNTDTRDGYGGTNGPHIMLRSSAKSSIAAVDEGDNIGQISYQGLTWTLGENVGWGNQNIRMPILGGGGNRVLQADNNGQLFASNDIPGGDNDYIQNQYGGAQGANFWISGIGRADNGVVTGSSGTYNTFYTWTDLPGHHGFYSSVHNGAHFYPNSGSYGAWRIAGNRNGWQGLEFDAAGGNLSLMMGSTGQGWGGQTTGIHNNAQGQWLWRFEHQRLWADGLTDINDAGYYIDPNGTSNINEQLSNTLRTGYLDFRYAGSNSGQGTHPYAIFQEGGDWTHPYPDLRIAYHTGIKLGANASYNGIRFYTDYDMSSLVMAVNDGSTSGAGNVYMSGQLGVGGTPNGAAQLDVNSTNRGFLPPRMSTGQRDAISGPAAGLIIYNNSTNCVQLYTPSGWVNMGCGN